MHTYEGLLKKADHCYLGERFFYQPVFRETLVMRRNASQEACSSETCTAARKAPSAPVGATPAPPPGRTWRTEMYHVRRNRTIYAKPCCRPPALPLTIPTSRFLFWGDSTARNSWDVLLYQARRPCKIAWEPRNIQEVGSVQGCLASGTYSLPTGPRPYPLACLPPNFS